MRKLMHYPQFRARLFALTQEKSDVESELTFSLLALAVRLYIRLQNVPPSFITLTEFLLYLEGQRDDEKAELWKRVYRDGSNVAKARMALEGAVLAQEGIETIRDKQRAFVDALSERSMLQSVSEKVYREGEVDPVVLRTARAIAGLVGTSGAEANRETERVIVKPECTGVSASWCPVCGECSCPREEDGEWGEPNEDCPLHGRRSTHAERTAEQDEREMLQALVIRALDQGQKPKCQRCFASWERGKATRCTEGGGEHDWGLELKCR